MPVRDLLDRDIPQVHALLVAHGWSHRLGTLSQFEALVAASQCNLVALNGDEVVGYARAITDGLSNGYLSMLVVATAFRGQGLGRALVQQTLAKAPAATWVLRAGRPGASDFFARMGFAPSAIAMERTRST
ncbi:GNAT family acetyltransferase [Acidovorax sp. Root267]|uniref:GNAT family N-acetyltransferase n=1 Tax=Acidovorax sp. Root267 TaxID=1736505 RepID=UPI0007107E9F|nr:GNAT family N-acetyltransferase [Acidovorax sp. Root267]KRD27195.1 GNAT family acetyltransferase [Acidovorax sp. Root267]